ncbi:MAG: RDD family protein [Mycobacterium sp.]
MTTGEHDPYGQPSGYPAEPNPYGGGYPPPPPGYPPVPNVYPAPGGYPGAPQQVWGGHPGGLGVRFGARVIDGLLVGLAAGLLSSLFHASSSIMVTGLFTGLLMFVYFVAMEVTQGRTLGKMLLGLSVHGPGGAPKPDFKQSAIRNAFTLLTIIPFGGLLTFIAMVWIAMTINSSPTKQGKHDELAGGTQVVKG